MKNMYFYFNYACVHSRDQFFVPQLRVMLSHGSKRNMLPSSRPAALIYSLNIKEQCCCAGCELFSAKRSDTWGKTLLKVHFVVLH